MRLVFTILDIALAVVYLATWAFGRVTGKTITLAGDCKNFVKAHAALDPRAISDWAC
jgi:hypothetical protein